MKIVSNILKELGYIDREEIETSHKFVVPEGIRAVYKEAFYNLPIEEIVLPSTLYAVDDFAFAYSNLKKIKHTEVDNDGNVVIKDGFPDRIRRIGIKSFMATKLTELDMPDSVIYAGRSAFACAPIKRVKLSENLTYLSPGVFSYCDLRELYFPEKCKSAHDRACAENKHLEKVHFSSQMTKIENKAFQNCAIKDVDIPASVENIGADCFRGCGVENLNLRFGLKSIGTGAFYGAKMKNVVLPESLRFLGLETFAGNSNLKSIAFPVEVGQYVSGAVDKDRDVEFFINEPQQD